MSPCLSTIEGGIAMKTAYPAVIHPEDGRFWVEFPDLDGCFSDGDTLAEAAINAEEALGAYLCSLIERNIPLPDASDIQSVRADNGFTSIIATEPLNYIKSTKSVKKTLTIPEWLNTAAESRHINFSSVLQQALISVIE